ncbi:hypothetical protein ACFQ21_06605 [Ohtaekwangia kribbensis]|uniref:Zinc finger LSD1-type domain-containing protein n=1 Tax=Ohtaekwangia kribbensis TaxID=688913 RepID=A0ABW3K0M2_9BACT
MTCKLYRHFISIFFTNIVRYTCYRCSHTSEQHLVYNSLLAPLINYRYIYTQP